MRLHKFFMIVGLITMASVFYIYQQCVVAFRPLEKQIKRLSSFDFEDSRSNSITSIDMFSTEGKINGDFSDSDAKLRVAKR